MRAVGRSQRTTSPPASQRPPYRPPGGLRPLVHARARTARQGPNAERRGTDTDASRLLRSSPSPPFFRSSTTRSRQTRVFDETEDTRAKPDPDPDHARDVTTRASPKSPSEKKASMTKQNKTSVALDFSAETRRAMDAGRARRAEILAAYEAVKQRCAVANAVLKTSDDETSASDEAFSRRLEPRDRSPPRAFALLEKQTSGPKPKPFVVPSREETLRLIRDMEDRARRAHERDPVNESVSAPPDPPTHQTERQDAFEKHTRDASERGLRKFRLPPSFEPFGPAKGSSEFGTRRPSSTAPPNAIVEGENASDSDDSAGLTPPPREKDAARFFLRESVEKQTGGFFAAERVPSVPRREGFDVPGVEPELSVRDVRDFESLVAYAFH